jgi:subtilisin family serine protease
MTSRWHKHGTKRRKGLFSAWHHVHDVDEIWINIKEIRLVSERGTVVTVSTKEQSVNLLEIKDDASVLFADTLLPQGKYSQIRLVLAGNNGHVIKNGKQYPLQVPSSEQSGFKLKGDFTIVSGLILRISLDFSIESLLFKFGWQYVMKPVIRVDEIETMLPFVPGILQMKLKTKVTISADSRGLFNQTGLSSLDAINVKYECVNIVNFLEHMKFQNIDAVTASKVGLDRIFIFAFRDRTDILEAMLEYAGDPNVEQVFPDTIMHSSAVPNDPQATGAQNTYLTDINAFNGWDVTTGSASITVAVLDTGVDHLHADLAGKVVLGDSFYMDYCTQTVCAECGCVSQQHACLQRGNKDSTDVESHGTHVAGILGAVTNNSTGIAGINWQSPILSVRVLDKHGKGALNCGNKPTCGSESMIGAGIVEATQQGARVINLSLGGDAFDVCYPNGVCLPSNPVESAAVEYAFARGVVIVAATGNENKQVYVQPGSPTQQAYYPATYKNVIAVGALNTGTTSRANFSNYGKVDVVAPGTGIYSTIPNNSYAFYAGTSMATPQVAGLASLILSRNSRLLPEIVARAIYTTATDINAGIDPNPACVIGVGYDNCTGWGRINVAAALNSVLVIPTPIDNGDGTITDMTNLMWMKCSLGQNLTDPGCAGGAAGYTWANAFGACSGLNFAGYTDWRLPTRDELNSIIKCANGNPTPPADNSSKCYQIPTGIVNINGTYFPITSAGFATSIYWTASDFGNCGFSPCPWVTVFDPGGTGYGYRSTNPAKVRCVRNP